MPRRALLLLICLLCLPIFSAHASELVFRLEDVPVDVVAVDTPPRSTRPQPAPRVIYVPGDAERPPLGDASQLEVHFINIGAADCILLRCGGRAMLVDGGHFETAGIVLDYLDTLGVTMLDYALLTHPHNDHIGGFLRIFEQIPVRVALCGQGYESFSSQLYQDVLDCMRDAEIPYLCVDSGSALTLGDAVLTFYQWKDPKASVNDRSVAMVASLGHRRMLFAADIENNGQQALAERYGNLLSADIVKMPHHGLAAYMREFHEASQPALAVFSNSKYGILDRTKTLVKQRGVDSLYTVAGTVVAVTDGETWFVWQDTP